MQNIFKKLMDKISNGISAGKVAYDKVPIREPLYKAASSVSAVAGGAVGAVGEALDSASGKKMYEHVQERLELQGRYNDILAIKLDEALKRIGQLEEKVAKHDQ